LGHEGVERLIRADLKQELDREHQFAKKAAVAAGGSDVVTTPPTEPAES
jgi:hypothetical protein